MKSPKYSPLLLGVVLMTACDSSEREQKLADEILELKTSNIQKEADQKLAKLREDHEAQLAKLPGKLDKLNREKATAEAEASKSQAKLDQARAQALQLQNALAQVQVERDLWQKQLNKQQFDQLQAQKERTLWQGQLAAYENLGTPLEIKTKLDKLAKLVATVKINEAVAWVSDPSDPQNVLVESQIRFQLKEPEGELTKADLDKVTLLSFDSIKITDAGLKEVAKLENLTMLFLEDTQVTKAGVAQLQKALPKCEIRSNPTK